MPDMMGIMIEDVDETGDSTEEEREINVSYAIVVNVLRRIC